jgi:hypothetical protein
MSEEELRELEKRWCADDDVTLEAAQSLVTEIRRLRAVLEWYGDEKNYTTQCLGNCPIENSYIAEDMGDRAREALAEGSGE